MTIELTRAHLEYLNIGMRYWGADLFKLTDEQKDCSREYVRGFKKNLAQGQGLFIFGRNGCGKTYLAAALLKYAWSNWRVSGYCVTAGELKNCWIVNNIPANEGSEELMKERIEDIRLLLVDDIGKEYRSATGFSENQFGVLLRNRSKKMKTTIITSNLSLEQFGKVYGTSTGKLIKENFSPVCMVGEDMRMKAKNTKERISYAAP